jgi:hypothetical protein
MESRSASGAVQSLQKLPKERVPLVAYHDVPLPASNTWTWLAWYELLAPLLEKKALSKRRFASPDCMDMAGPTFYIMSLADMMFRSGPNGPRP